MFKRLLLLKRSQIFSMVPTEDLRRVAGSLEEIRFFSGDRIFEINDQGDHLYLLVSGKVGISIDPKPATSHVFEDTVGLTLEKARLRGLILSYPEISIGMLRSLSMRLREANLRAPVPDEAISEKMEKGREGKL